MEKIKLPVAKRIFDIATTVIILIISSPFIVLVFLAMTVESIFRPESRGRFFYSETRISQGEPFTLYKFRIFKKDSLENNHNQESVIQTKELERDLKNLTFVGKMLKQIYLDELPQLINVLEGEMSLVGPRPTNVANFQRWMERGQYSKYLVKAGVTGVFQAQKGQRLGLNQNDTDMKYVEFCRNNPGWKVVLYDIRILLKSVFVILKAEGI